MDPIPERAAPPNSDQRATSSQAPPAEPAAYLSLTGTYIRQSLDDAELLLSYATEMGIGIEDKVRNSVLHARTAGNAGTVTEEVAANLLTALASLAATVRPVSVASLRSSSNGKADRQILRTYAISAFTVGLLVLFISLLTFVSSRVSESVKADVATANALAANLALELGPPPSTNEAQMSATGTSGTPPALANPVPSEQIWFGAAGPPAGVSPKDVINDLQKFAATMRAIDVNARQLNQFVLNSAYVPFGNLRTNWPGFRQKFELSPGLRIPLASEFSEKLQVYQEIRNFANTVLGMTSVYYGAIATCILPVLYALLGAAAYLLRLYDDQVRNRTFVTADKHVARFLIAAIGGLVVGQFNVAPGVAISPFAVAFLVGYAADLFFAFLDNLLQIFKRDASAKGPQVPSSAPVR